MTTDTPISRAKALASMLPIVAIVLIGFYAHKHYGTDGIAGVLLGLYLILYMAIAVRNWVPDNLPPHRAFIHRFRKVFMLIGLLGIIGGTLDMFGLL